MHPPLFRPHPKCAEVVDLLVKCHEENVLSKFLGACNDQKRAMDQCFKAEKEEKRRENMLRAREAEERFQRKLESYEKEKKAEGL